MTAWCLGVIAQPALSPQRCIIDVIHPPDECVSLRQPALKDLWRIREALSAVSLTSLLFFCLSLSHLHRTASHSLRRLCFLAHTNVSQMDTMVQRHKHKVKSQRLHFHSITDWLSSVIKGQQVLQRPCVSYLQQNISLFCSLSPWSGSFFLFGHLFSSFFSLLHFTPSPLGVCGARRDGKTLTLRMKWNVPASFL